MIRRITSITVVTFPLLNPILNRARTAFLSNYTRSSNKIISIPTRAYGVSGPSSVSGENYITDKSVIPEHKAVLHELYQLCVKKPYPVAEAYDHLSRVAQQTIKGFGSVESFCALHSKYIRCENGMMVAFQAFRSNGSPRLFQEIIGILVKNNNAPMSAPAIFAQLTPGGKVDFRVTKTKTLTLFAKERHAMFTVSNSGMISLTKQAYARATENPSTNNQSQATGAALSQPSKDLDNRIAQGLQDALINSVANASHPINYVKLAWTCFPNNFFIPVSRAFTAMEELEPRVRALGIENLVLQLRTLPPRYIEMVCFAGPNTPKSEVHLHTYVRLVASEIVVKDLPTGDDKYPEYEIACRLGADLIKYLAPHSSFKMEQLQSLLPPNIFSSLPFKGSAMMLIFDRLQHFFDVDKKTMTVSVSGEAGLATKDLTKANTPTPLELRAALNLLGTSGVLAPAAFERLLDQNIKKRLITIYGSLPRFVNAHKAELWVENMVLVTPETALIAAKMSGKDRDASEFGVPHIEKLIGDIDAKASYRTEDKNSPKTNSVTSNEGGADEFDVDDILEGGTGGSSNTRIIPALPIPRMTARQLAEYLYQCIPSDRCVSWMTLRGFVDLSVFQHSAFSVGDPRDFFASRPDLFVTFDPAFINGFIIGRANVKQPTGTWEEVKDIYTVIKMIAMVSAGGVSEAAAIQLVPRDIRSIIKRCGGMEHLLSQVPEWFHLSNPTGLPGHAILTYIGHLNPKIKQVPSPYPTYIPCIPDNHNIKFNKAVDFVTGSASNTAKTKNETNEDIDDPYSDYCQKS